MLLLESIAIRYTMDNVKLPTEKAQEPAEEAHQPKCKSGSTMSTQEEGNKPKKRHATFAETAMSAEKELSQTSSAYKEALSQPAASLPHRQRLLWLQRRRGPGLWAQCDACGSWRHLPHVLDSYQLPPKWYCSMNPDKSMADCTAPEATMRITDEEDVIHNEYSCGSLVWARLPGWPWWPAMVDDCPDTEQFYWLDGFSDIPTHYNVVFFDATDASRAWIDPENLKPYTANKKKFRHLLNSKKYKKRLEKAMQEADKAEELPVADRLEKFSFVSTFKGPIVSPKKVSKRDLERYQMKLKRKYNVEFPIEDTSESDDESVQAFRAKNKKNNVIIIGTPKSKRTEQGTNSNKDNDYTVVKQTAQRKQNKNNEKDKEENELNERNNMNAPPKQNLRNKPKNKTNGIGNPETVPRFATENNVNVFSIASTATTETCEQSFKLPDSMAIEIGSTQSVMNGFDNDSSKTYAPEEEFNSIVMTQDFQVRVTSPSSDDFEF